jgi:uncharacterized membrane protein
MAATSIPHIACHPDRRLDGRALVGETVMAADGGTDDASPSLLWQLVPPWLRALPADLAATVVLVLLTDLAVLLPGVSETPLRIVLGLPFVLFLPGYAFIAALFPEQGESPVAEESELGAGELDGDESEGYLARRGGRGGIDGIERVALSFGLSIAVVPLIGLVLNFTPWGIRLVPILLSVSGFTLVAAVVAAHRRWALPPEERFSVPYREWYAAGRAELFEPETRTDAALNVLLVFSILLATASVGYAVAVPKQGETFTEFYLLTEDDDGDLVAAGYPTEFVVGKSKPLVVGIGNQEHEPVQYAVVVLLQDVRFVNNETVVVREAELDRLHSGEVAHNETWMRTYEVQPTHEGERLRLLFLLYRDAEVPAEPTVANSYRDLRLWVNVTAG